MKALYVIDGYRNLVFGQFFKQSSADEVAAILKHATIEQTGIRIINEADWYFEILMEKVAKREFRKGTEADLVSISNIKYFPKPNIRWALFTGSVVTIGGGQQMVVVGLETAGRKWNTYKLRGLQDGKPYSYKVPPYQDGKAKHVRMATPNEFHGAREQRAKIDANKQARVNTNRTQVETLTIKPGDVVTVNYSDVGHKTEVVEDVNMATGRVAIRRRGVNALVAQKRRFINAKSVVKIVERGPGRYNASNPMYEKYGFGPVTEAQVARANSIKSGTALDRVINQLLRM